jgi:hypothetical protein
MKKYWWIWLPALAFFMAKPVADGLAGWTGKAGLASRYERGENSFVQSVKERAGGLFGGYFAGGEAGRVRGFYIRVLSAAESGDRVYDSGGDILMFPCDKNGGVPYRIVAGEILFSRPHPFREIPVGGRLCVPPMKMGDGYFKFVVGSIKPDGTISIDGTWSAPHRWNGKDAAGGEITLVATR